MMRRKYALSRGGAANNEETNPLDGVANLADVMLVVACGLMLALVINWNVDITPKTAGNAAFGEEVSQVEALGGTVGEALDEETQYEEVGKVYRDPNTGKLYMIEK